MIVEGLMNLMKGNPIRIPSTATAQIPVDIILATDGDLLTGLFMIFVGLCSLKIYDVKD